MVARKVAMAGFRQEGDVMSTLMGFTGIPRIVHCHRNAFLFSARDCTQQALTRCWFNVGSPSLTACQHYTNIWLRLVFLGTQNTGLYDQPFGQKATRANTARPCKHQTLARCWFNVDPAVQSVFQH